eukprot:1125418-Pyramimonas_sp.AAC.1
MRWKPKLPKEAQAACRELLVGTPLQHLVDVKRAWRAACSISPGKELTTSIGRPMLFASSSMLI